MIGGKFSICATYANLCSFGKHKNNIKVRRFFKMKVDERRSLRYYEI
jgi:hypothetical protein